MRLIAIVARSANNIMGNNGALPWPHNREDLAWFKRITLGDPMIMGRKTFASLPGILPGRPHFVVTSNVKRLSVSDSNVAFLPMDALDEVLESFERGGRDRVFVIGGAQLLEKLGPSCDTLLLRTFHENYEGDIEFPTDAFAGMTVVATEKWSDSITETLVRNKP